MMKLEQVFLNLYPGHCGRRSVKPAALAGEQSDEGFVPFSVDLFCLHHLPVKLFDHFRFICWLVYPDINFQVA